MIASRRSASLTAFNMRVDAWVAQALADGIADSGSILRRLPGVYPTELLASLDRLAVAGLIDTAIPDAARRQMATETTHSSEGRSLLPLPHPLGSGPIDWLDAAAPA